MCHFQQFQWIWRGLTIIYKILKNMHFRNRKIQLSSLRAVWSVSLLRPHSGRHTETAIINNYFVFQDLEFPFFSIFKYFLNYCQIPRNPLKTPEVGKCRNNGDTSYPQLLFLFSCLKSNQSNFQLHWSKRKVVSSILTYPSKKT